MNGNVLNVECIKLKLTFSQGKLYTNLGKFNFFSEDYREV